MFFDSTNYIVLDRVDLDDNLDLDGGKSRFQLEIVDTGNAEATDYPDTADKLRSEYDLFKNPPPPQIYEYQTSSGTIADTPLTDAGVVQINLGDLGIDFVGTDPDDIQGLLSSGRFSYTEDTVNDLFTLTFGDGNTFPIQRVTLNSPPPQIELTPSTGAALTYAASSNDFIDALNAYTVRAPAQVEADTHLVLGSATEQTADFSALSEQVVLDLASRTGTSRTGTLDSHAIAVFNIEHITGGDGNDILTGNDNANTLIGGAGTDTLTGGGGDDTLTGGAGIDTYIYRYTAADKDGKDTIATEVSSDRNIIRIVVADTSGRWSDLVEVEKDSTTLTLTMRDSRGLLDNANTLSLTLDDIANSRFSLRFATSDDLSIPAPPALTFNLEELLGDIFVTRTSASGPQTLNVVRQDTRSVEGDPTEGDTVSFATFTGSDEEVTLDLSDASPQAQITDAVATPAFSQTVAVSGVRHITGGAGADTLTGNDEDNTLTGGAGADTLTGGAGADTLIGGAGDDTLKGEGGVDTIDGGDGDDIIEGGSRGDIIDGGGGTDTVSYKGSSTAVTVDLSDGNTETGGDAAGDRLRNIENIVGSDYIDPNGILTGDIIIGDNNPNILEGGAGTDTLTGGVGADTYVYHYTAARKDGIDTIDTEADAGNILHIHLDSLTNAWNTDANNLPTGVIRFERESFTDIRLVFNTNRNLAADPAFDSSNYIIVDKDDLVDGSDGKFSLRLSDGTNSEDVSAADVKAAYGAYQLNIPADFTYDTDGFASVSETSLNKEYIIDLSALIPDFASASINNVNDLLASGRIAFFRTGTGGVDLKIVFLDANGVLDTDDALTFSNVYSGGNRIQAFTDLPVFFRDGNGVSLNIPRFGEAITIATGDLVVAAADILNIDGNGNTHATFETLLGSDKTLEISPVDAALAPGENVLLAVIRDTSSNLVGSIVLRDVKTITGGAGADMLTGGASADTLIGGDGADTLTGGAEDDTLMGGAGEDIYVFDGPSGTDTIEGETGNNILRFEEATAVTNWQQQFAFSLSAIDPFELTINFANDRSIVIVKGYTAANFQFQYGTPGATQPVSVVLGTANDDTSLVGTGEADAIFGFGGDDTLEGGAGEDTLDGGADEDTLSYANEVATSGVVVDLNINSLTSMQSANSYDAVNDLPGFKRDNIVNFEHVIGSDKDDKLIGDSKDNTLTGGDGDDIIEGGDGVDTIDGGAGDDIIEGGAGEDILDGGAGDSDTLSYANEGAGVIVNLETQSATNADSSLRDTIIGGFENVIGSTGDDTLTGNNLDNILEGGVGVDTLTGGVGADTLEGGAGTDTLEGGEGTDTLEGGAGTDTLEGGDGADTYVYHYTNTRTDGIDTITEASEVVANILQVRIADPTNAWNTNADNLPTGVIRFAADDTSSNVRLAFNTNTDLAADPVFDLLNYIVVDRNDLVDGKFSLSLSDGTDSVDVSAADVKEAYKAYQLNIPVDFTYGTDVFGSEQAANLAADTEYIIDLSALIPDFTSAGIDTLDDLLASGRIAFFRTGTGDADLKIVFLDANGVLDTDDALTFEGAYDSSDDPIPNFATLGVVLRDGDAKTIVASEFGNSLNAVTATGDAVDVAADTFSIDGNGNTHATFETLLGSDKTLEISPVDAALLAPGENVLLAVIKDTSGIVGSIILRNVKTITGGAGADTLTGGAGEDTLTGGAGEDTYIYRYTAADKDGIDTITETEVGVENTIRIVLGAVDAAASWHEDYVSVKVNGDAVELSMRDDTGIPDAAHVLKLTLAEVMTGRFSLEFVSAANPATVVLTVAADILKGAVVAGTDSTPGTAETLEVVRADTIIVQGDPNEGDTVSFATFTGSDEEVTLDLSDASPQAQITDTVATPAFSQTVAVSGVRHIIGGAGADTLSGNADANRIDGGAGADTVSYKGSSDAVTVDLSDGNTETGGDAAGDTLSNIENIVGSDYIDPNGILTGDTITGDDNPNIIEGGKGSDTLEGRAGADTYVYYYTADDKDGADTITDTGGSTGDTLEIRVIPSFFDAAETQRAGSLIGGEKAKAMLKAIGVDSVLPGTDANSFVLTFDNNNQITLYRDTSNQVQIEEIKIVNNDDPTMTTTIANTDWSDLLDQVTAGTITFNDPNPPVLTLALDSDVSLDASTLDGGGDHEGGFTIDISGLLANTDPNDPLVQLQVDELRQLQLLEEFSFSKDGEDLKLSFGTGQPTLTISDAYEDVSGQDRIKSFISSTDTILTFRFGSGDGEEFEWSMGNVLFDSTIDSGEKTYIFEANRYYAVLDEAVSDNVADLSGLVTNAFSQRVQVLPDGDDPTQLVAHETSPDGFPLAPPSDTRRVGVVAQTFFLKGFDTILGSDGRDLLVGNDQDNIFDAGLGNDWLEGGAGADTLTGGADDDMLAGGDGGDTYIYHYNDGRKDGKDAIVETEAGIVNTNTIRIVLQTVTSTDDWKTLVDVLRQGENVLLKFDDLNIITLKYDAVIDGRFSLEFVSAADPATVVLTVTPSVLSGPLQTTVVTGVDPLIVNPGDTTGVVGDGNNDDTISFELFGSNDVVTLDLSEVTVEASIALDGGSTQNVAVSNVRDITGGAGNDILTGDDDTANPNKIEGGEGADKLYGGEGDDTLYGGTDAIGETGTGDDTLEGGAGADTLYGGDGEDTYVLTGQGGTDTDKVNEVSGGNSILHFKSLVTISDWQQYFSAFELDRGDLTMTYGGGSKVNIDITEGTFQFRYGAGGDTEILDIVLGTASGDTLTFGINTADDIILGFGGKDTLTGGAGNDLLYGGTEDDTLTGGAGDDTLAGGAGTDTYVFGGQGGTDTDTINEESGGKSILHFKNLITTSGWQQYFSAFELNGDELTITYDGGSKVKIDILEGTFEFRYGAGGDTDILDIVLGTASGDTLTFGGNTADDIILGFGGADIIEGGDGADTLDGGAGDDIIEGGLGVDNLDGRDDNLGSNPDGKGDTLSYANEGVGVIVNLETQSATNAADNSLRDNIENFENVIGSTGDDKLTGDDKDNTLEGGAGNDKLYGGVGDDTYVYHYSTDVGGRKDGIDLIVDSEANTAKGNTVIFYVAESNLEAISDATFQASLTKDNFFDRVGAMIGLRAGDGDSINKEGNNGETNEMSRLGFHFETSSVLYIQGKGIEDGVIALKFVSTTDASEGTISAATLKNLYFPDQGFVYEPSSGSIDRNFPGAGDVTIDLGNLLSFSADNTDDAQIKELLSSGRFSYEKDGDNIILTFGDGSTTHPIQTLTLNNLASPKVTLKTNVDLEYSNTGDSTGGLLEALNEYTANTPDANGNYPITDLSKTYLIKGSSTETDDTADLSTLSEQVVLDLATGKGTVDDVLGGRDVAIFDIENIKSGSGNDILTGDANPNILDGGVGNDTLEGGAGADTLTGGAGADTYVYYHTTARKDGIDTISAEPDPGNILKIVVDNMSQATWGQDNNIYFQTHTDLADPEVRVAFNNDVDNYILMSRDDLAMGRFELKVYDESDNELLTLDAVMLKEAYDGFALTETPQEYIYDSTISRFCFARRIGSFDHQS